MYATFADKVISFNSQLNYTGELPQGFRVINPFLDHPETMQVMAEFYHKYYNDNSRRKFIIGINPGRHGAAITGVPFTDTKRLADVCGIEMKTEKSHEVSSVFVYDMIEEFGGVEAFYSQYYINSIFPLAIVREKMPQKWVNANYYDDNELFALTEPYMIECLKQQIDFGLDTDQVFVLGAKNAAFIKRVNDKVGLFGKMYVLEHPRYIQQYKQKEKQQYIDKYLITLKS